MGDRFQVDSFDGEALDLHGAQRDDDRACRAWRAKPFSGERTYRERNSQFQHQLYTILLCCYNIMISMHLTRGSYTSRHHRHHRSQRRLLFLCARCSNGDEQRATTVERLHILAHTFCCLQNQTLSSYKEIQMGNLVILARDMTWMRSDNTTKSNLRINPTVHIFTEGTHVACPAIIILDFQGKRSGMCAPVAICHIYANAQ
jgi:hypothetical protein